MKYHIVPQLLHRDASLLLPRKIGHHLVRGRAALRRRPHIMIRRAHQLPEQLLLILAHRVRGRASAADLLLRLSIVSGSPGVAARALLVVGSTAAACCPGLHRGSHVLLLAALLAVHGAEDAVGLLVDAVDAEAVDFGGGIEADGGLEPDALAAGDAADLEGGGGGVEGGGRGGEGRLVVEGVAAAAADIVVLLFNDLGEVADEVEVDVEGVFYVDFVLVNHVDGVVDGFGGLGEGEGRRG